MVLFKMIRRGRGWFALPGAAAAAAALMLTPSTSDDDVYDVAVIGGGIVGLAIARECAVRNYRVALFEKEDCFAAQASSGNSGLGCTGYDSPKGSLERKLLRRSIRLHQNLYRSFGLSHAHVKKCGSLVVAWTPEQMKKLPTVLEENRDAGDVDAQLLSRDELLELEPNLSSRALGAVLCPYEAIVEPWLVPIGYAESARRHGARLQTNSAVTGATFDPAAKIWRLCVQKTSNRSVGRSLSTKELLVQNVPEPAISANAEKAEVKARVVINAAGLYGDRVEKMRNEKHPSTFTITPRKGQFVVFKVPESDSSAPFTERIIEPVATQFTKGVIAWTTVYGNVIVGPTAVDQASRDDRSTDEATIQKLIDYGKSVLPALSNAEVVGTYSGLRPASEHRDYVIASDAEHQWISVGGIRSTGLTASSGIGEYVADLHEKIKRPEYIPWADRADGDVNALPGVSESACNPLPVAREPLRNPLVPPLEELARDYRDRGDGTVRVYGRIHRVTHPISSFGMETLPCE